MQRFIKKNEEPRLTHQLVR